MKKNQNDGAATSTAVYIGKRELRQNRFARLSLVFSGFVILASGVAGFSLDAPSPFRCIVIGLSLLCYVMSYSTLLCGVWTIGMAPQALTAAYFFACAVLWDWLFSPKPLWIDIMIISISSVALLLITLFISILMVMLFGSFGRRSKGAFTAVVLGCKLNGDKPGRMLKRRLDIAYQALSADSEHFCIVTGGKAANASRSESEAMRDYLIEKGLSPDRIIPEDKAATTYENFLFSKRLIDALGLPETAVVITDRFHQFRAKRIANSAGLPVYSLCCETAWYLTSQFWLREALCIIERILRGHW